MIGRIIRSVASEILRRRSGGAVGGYRRPPPTHRTGARQQIAQSLIRTVLNRFMRR